MSFVPCSVDLQFITPKVIDLTERFSEVFTRKRLNRIPLIGWME